MKKMLKKILTLGFFAFLFIAFSFFVFNTDASAQAVACTANTAACHPEWADSVDVCNAGTFNPATSTCYIYVNGTVLTEIAICSATNNTGPCRAARVNEAAANQTATTAQQLAQARGYNATCVAESLGLNGGTDPNTGLGYYYNTVCTVNGLAGVSAEMLVSGGQNWNILATELASTSRNLALLNNTVGVGCLSNRGFSSINGLPCENSSTYPPGCSANSKFSTTTGRSCSGGTSSASVGASVGSSTPPASSSGSSASAAALSTGYNSSWYYRDPYSSSSSYDGSVSREDVVRESSASLSSVYRDSATRCTGYENTSACHPEWAISGSLCNANNMSGACSPELVNPYAAAGATRKAEALARLKGYDAYCSSKYISYRPGNNPSTGLNYYYVSECTLEGSSRVSVQDINNATPSWWTQLAQTVRPKFAARAIPAIATISAMPANNSAAASTSVIASASAASASPLNTPYRYLRFTTAEAGWVSWKDINIYDKQGNKINGITAKASSEYSGTWQSPRVAPQVASNVLDNNPNTVWNAGETNTNCNQGTYASSCINSTRTASITLDLGSSKLIGQIKLLESGDTRNEITLVEGSTNGSSYTAITQFRAPISNGQWLSYPYTPNSNLPGPKFAVKFRKTDGTNDVDRNKNYPEALALVPATSGDIEITIPHTVVLPPPYNVPNKAEWYAYLWKAENTDYIKVSKEITTDASLGTQTAAEKTYCATLPEQDSWLFPNLWNSPLGSYNMSPITLLSGDLLTPPSIGLVPNGFYASTCNIGKVYKTTFTATNVDSGKTAVFTATIKIKR